MSLGVLTKTLDLDFKYITYLICLQGGATNRPSNHSPDWAVTTTTATKYILRDAAIMVFGSMWLAYGSSLNIIRDIYKHAPCRPVIMVSQMAEAPLFVKSELQTYIYMWPMDSPPQSASNAETSAKGVTYGRYNLYLVQYVSQQKQHGVTWNIAFERQYIMRCYSITSPPSIALYIPHCL